MPLCPQCVLLACMELTAIYHVPINVRDMGVTWMVLVWGIVLLAKKAKIAHNV